MNEIVPLAARAAHRMVAACDGEGCVYVATVRASPSRQELRIAPADGARGSGGEASRPLVVTAASIPDVRLALDGAGRLVTLWTQPGAVGMQLWFAIRTRDGRWGDAAPIAGPFGGVLAPAVATDVHGRVWCAYQGTATGKQQVFVTWLAGDEWSFAQRISDGDGHCFAPAICRFGDGVRAVWDGRIDGRYGLWMRELDTDPDLTRREPQATVAAADTLLANAAIAAIDDERSLVVYERAQRGWGGRNRVPRRSRAAMSKGNYLQARRDLHAALIGPEGMAPLTTDLNRRFNRVIPSPVRTQPRVAVDGSGAVWLSWRQIESLDDAEPETGFVQAASVYRGGRWSDPVVLPDSGGTSGMEAHLTPDPAGGVLLTYAGRAKGRYHGRVVSLPAVGDGGELPIGRFKAMRLCDFNAPSPAERIPLGDPYDSPRLLWGDLHRHTNLSECRWWVEGPPNDAYRYALAAAELDFLAVTDHARSLAAPDTRADAFNLARAYDMPGVFTALCAWEASGPDGRGHMVVLTDRQAERIPLGKTPTAQAAAMDSDHAVAIPHHTGDPRSGYTWDGHEDDLAPIAEIYQPYRGSFEGPGCPAPETAWARDGNQADPQGALSAAWGAGLKLGVIASSDHLATGGAFAGVWADGNTRRDILQALRGRRCFAATAKIELAFRADDHVMGESYITATNQVTFAIRCRAPGTIRTIELLGDGRVVHAFRPGGKTGRRRANVRKRLSVADGEHVYYVRVQLHDRNMAWSSPIWITGHTS